MNDFQFVKMHYPSAKVEYSLTCGLFVGKLDDTFTPIVFQNEDKNLVWSKMRQFICRYGVLVEDTQTQKELFKAIKNCKTVSDFFELLEAKNFGFVQF